MAQNPAPSGANLLLFSNPHTTLRLPTHPTRRRLAAAGLGASVLAVAVATLTPIPEQAARSALTPFLCLACGDAGGADLIRNLFLFVPVGLSVAALGGSRYGAFLAGFGLSGLVESLQYMVIAGRDAALGDLVANGLGAAAGWGLWVSARYWLLPTPRVARRLGAAWVVLTGTLTTFTWWGLAPDLPGAPWYGQWSPVGPEPEFFSGKVVSVRAGGIEVPHWRLPGEIQQRIARELQSRVRLEAEIVRGPTDPGGRRIVSLSGETVRFTGLGTDGEALLFSVRTRSARLLLLSPRFRLPGGVRAGIAESLTVSGEYSGHRATVRSKGPVERSISVALTPLDAWVFLGPETVPGPAGLLILRSLTLLGFVGPLWLWRPWRGTPGKTNRPA